MLIALEKFSEVKVVNFGEVTSNYQIANCIEAVILSGSAARIVNPVDRAKFEDVEQLIKNCSLPILGICFGHQLLCWAFGVEVGTLPQQVANRFEHVKAIQPNEIFRGFQNGQTIPLAENHYDYVLKDSLESAGFTLLADSASCEVEAVKHKTKPFFGVQFHPERIIVNGETHPEGHRVIANFYQTIVKR